MKPGKGLAKKALSSFEKWLKKQPLVEITIPGSYPVMVQFHTGDGTYYEGAAEMSAWVGADGSRNLTGKGRLRKKRVKK